MNVLSAFTGQKKIRPVYQFKRGNTFSSAKSSGDPSYQQQPSSSLVNILPARTSPSSWTSSTAAEEHVSPLPIFSTVPDVDDDDDDAIFDFPDSFDEFAEIKVMVASTRAIPEAPKLTRKRSKPKASKPPANDTKKRPISNKVTPRPIALAPAPAKNNNNANHAFHQDEFDIFAFDPQPTSHITFNYNNIQSTGPRRLANSYNPTPPNQNNRTRDYPVSIASVLRETIQTEKPLPVPVEKKRKRNLVARLKTARGEKENKPIHQGFDCLSDEDELALEQQQLNQQKSPIMPLRDIIKDRSMSPELTYEQTMQMQLDLLMKAEFGDDDASNKPQPQTEKKKRPHYQPLNKLNVRVTFQKK